MTTTPAQPSPRCQRCDYPLRGLPGGAACPECGLAFDLGDSDTFHERRPLSIVGRLILSTLGRPTSLVRVLLLIGLSFFLAQPPLIDRGLGICATLCLLIPILTVAGLRHVLLLDAAAGRERLYRRPIQTDLRRGFLLLGVTAILAIGTHFALPTRLWFYPLLPWFNHVAAEAETTLPETDEYAVAAPSLDRWIGPWRVRVKRRGDDVVFYTSGANFPGGGTGFVRTRRATGMPGYNAGADASLTPRWHAFVTD